jgi:DNA invertase Pin-like site-specific DNA recombinase
LQVGVYARVSTTDKDQEPETQLLPLREFCRAQGWQIIGEFVDRASANDLRGRTGWRDLLAQAARRKLDLIVVWKLDRAFRSVAHMATTVEQLRRWGVGLRSYSEPWLDTSGSSPVADLMLNILASFAQFERALIAERVRAGMDRARRQGRRLGRPGGTRTDGFEERWTALRPRVLAGEVGRREAARVLGVAPSTLRRLLHDSGRDGGMQIPTGSVERLGGPLSAGEKVVQPAARESQ